MSELPTDLKLYNLEIVNKLYNKTNTENVSSDIELDEYDSGCVFFVDISGGNVNITLPSPKAGIVLTFILTQINDPNFFRILTNNNSHSIFGTVLGYDSSSPPETILVSASGNSVKMVSSGSSTLTIGSRISVISDGTNYYILDDSSAAPLEIV